MLVDNALWRWRGRRWAHLASDGSYDELHDLARAIGKRRLGFQGDHYDVDEADRLRALSAGAEAVDSRTLVRRLRAAGLRRAGDKPRWQPLAHSPAGQPIDPVPMALAALADARPRELNGADGADDPNRPLDPDNPHNRSHADANPNRPLDPDNPHDRSHADANPNRPLDPDNPHDRGGAERLGAALRLLGGLGEIASAGLYRSINPGTSGNRKGGHNPGGHNPGGHNPGGHNPGGHRRGRLLAPSSSRPGRHNAGGSGAALAVLLDIPPQAAGCVPAAVGALPDGIVDLVWAGAPRRDGERSIELFVQP